MLPPEALPGLLTLPHACDDQRGWPGDREAVQEHHQRDVLTICRVSVQHTLTAPTPSAAGRATCRYRLRGGARPHTDVSAVARLLRVMRQVVRRRGRCR